MNDVLKSFLGKYGKQWDGREALRISGKTPYESAAVIIEDYGLPCSSAELMSQISPLFAERYRIITVSCWL